MSSEATPIQPLPEKRGSSPVLMLVIILAGGAFFLLFCGGIAAALLLPAIQAAREAARRSACVNNMKQIEIALVNYHDTYKSFPPAYVADANGKPMHSWRVLLLPFLEGNETYQKYDFNEPWDGPNNRKLAALAPSQYQCPSGSDFDGQTNYVAVVGPDTMWPGATPVSIRDIKDGTSRTISVIETAGSGINWLEPRDLTLDEALKGINPDIPPPNISSKHPGGVNAGFCDGHVTFLPDELPRPVLHSLLTKDGNENVDLSEHGL